MRIIKFVLIFAAIILLTGIIVCAQNLNTQYEIAAFPNVDTIQAAVKPAGQIG